MVGGDSMDGGGSTAGLLPGQGELGTLIAGYDWAASPLGPIAHWPRPLLDAVALILHAPVPMVLFWGPQLVALYNDAYARVIGDRHPASLGGAAEERWSHIWWKIGPLLHKVMATGAAETQRDEGFPSMRDGVATMAFFDISFSAVRDTDGSVGGVLGIVYDTTERVHASRAVSAERERLAQMFEQAPSFMALLREPGHIFELANHAYQQLVGGRATIGRSIADAVPEATEDGFVALLDTVVEKDMPYSGRAMPMRLRRGADGAVGSSSVQP